MTEAGCACVCQARGGGREKGSATFISELPSERIGLGWNLWDPASRPSPARGRRQQGPLPRWLPQCPLSLTFLFSHLCKSHGSNQSHCSLSLGIPTPPPIQTSPFPPPSGQDGPWNQHLPEPPERPPLTLSHSSSLPHPPLPLSSPPALASHEPSLPKFPPRHPHCPPLTPLALSDHPPPTPSLPTCLFRLSALIYPTGM